MVVKLHVPSAFTVAVPRLVVPSKISTVAPATNDAVPDRLIVLSEVMPSEELEPVSLPQVEITGADTLCTVKVKVRLLVPPSGSVAVMVTVLLPNWLAIGAKARL